MIEQAKKQNVASNLTFIVSKAEDIATKVDPASIDLVVAGLCIKLSLHRKIANVCGNLGEAAHWFDHKQLWPILGRILKPGGTVAYWVSHQLNGSPVRFFSAHHSLGQKGYARTRITGHPELTPLINEYCVGDSGLGPYWQGPGHGICHNLYRDISFPASEEWDPASGKRVYFTGDTNFPDLKLPFYPLPAGNTETPSLSRRTFERT